MSFRHRLCHVNGMSLRLECLVIYRNSTWHLSALFFLYVIGQMYIDNIVIIMKICVSWNKRFGIEIWICEHVYSVQCHLMMKILNQRTRLLPPKRYKRTVTWSCSTIVHNKPIKWWQIKYAECDIIQQLLGQHVRISCFSSVK